MENEYTEKRHNQLLTLYFAEIKAKEELQKKVSDLMDELISMRKELSDGFSKLRLIERVMSGDLTENDIDNLEDYYYRD